MKDRTETIPFYTSSITGAALQHRNGHYFFGKHLHTSMEIYLIRSGSCSMDIGDTTIHCSEGDFLMIFPNVLHSFYITGDKECTFYHIHFFTNFFTRILPREDSPVNLIHALMFACSSWHRQKADEDLRELVASAVSLWQSGSSRDSEINARLLCMLLHILNTYNTDNKASSQPVYQEKYVSFALNYIEKNYMNKILLEDIAKELHISSRYLGRLFSKYMNISPANYINIYRINKAIEIMESTTMTLTEIAGRIGLKDSQHFSRLFAHIIGMTPSNYRKMFLRRRQNM